MVLCQEESSILGVWCACFASTQCVVKCVVLSKTWVADRCALNIFTIKYFKETRGRHVAEGIGSCDSFYPKVSI